MPEKQRTLRVVPATNVEYACAALCAVYAIRHAEDRVRVVSEILQARIMRTSTIWRFVVGIIRCSLHSNSEDLVGDTFDDIEFIACTVCSINVDQQTVGKYPIGCYELL